jgi:hypothetical protein
LSEVAVARSGRPFGLGTETQAREEAGGLNSERARICTECGDTGGAEAIALLWCIGKMAQLELKKTMVVAGHENI